MKTLFCILALSLSISAQQAVNWANRSSELDTILLKIGEVLKVDPKADWKKRITVSGQTIAPGGIDQDKAVNVVTVNFPMRGKPRNVKNEQDARIYTQALADSVLAQIKTAIAPLVTEPIRLQVDIGRNFDSFTPTGETKYTVTPIHVITTCSSSLCISTATGGVHATPDLSYSHGQTKFASAVWKNY